MNQTTTLKHNLPACQFYDAGDTNLWDGFDEGGEWNGFDNVAVTPETFNKMLAKWIEEAPDGDDCQWVEDIREERGTPDERGLCSMAFGYCFTINKEDGAAHVAAENLPDLTMCTFEVDGDKGVTFNGVTDGTTWNGWNNVSVTPEVWEEMLTFWAKTGDITEMRKEYIKGRNGLVNLNGLCTMLVGAK